MQQINTADKKVCNSQKQKIIILNELTGVPGNHENAEGDDNTKDLGQAVEQKIVIETDQRNPCQREDKQDFLIVTKDQFIILIHHCVNNSKRCIECNFPLKKWNEIIIMIFILILEHFTIEKILTIEII